MPALAYAQDATIKLPQDITYKAALPGTPEVAVLFGTRPNLVVRRAGQGAVRTSSCLIGIRRGATVVVL
jgi:hypothetical protein